ncbi:hypothetical protein [Endozoicomonas numazuensis]|uniref:Uncharacterized protein n=1 Tax=Endozoicomonas numazuensis TaxID=1137799 RepID=A0A081N3S8_9GAMM|nr:hypothetical protein [Endozoicomonas numazuensis]KEQ13101.1 hypothetical protein GZ78_26470 [Endozoicomonas numazuensis]
MKIQRQIAFVGWLLSCTAFLCLITSTAYSDTMEWGGQPENSCLEEGALKDDRWSRQLHLRFNWIPYYQYGRVVRVAACNKDREQDWVLNDNSVQTLEGKSLKVFRWRKRFLPVTSYRTSKHLLSVRYHQQRLSFKYKGQSYCLILNQQKRFKTLPWEACLVSDNSRWLFGLPPDPGEDGLIGLVGVDSNNDGIRDDVERFIEQELVGSIEKKKAARQLAEVSQFRLENAFDREKILQLDGESSAAVLCLVHVMGQEASRFRHKMKARIYNTQERIEAWNKMNAYLSGVPYTLPDNLGSQCKFSSDDSNME